MTKEYTGHFYRCTHAANLPSSAHIVAPKTTNAMAHFIAMKTLAVFRGFTAKGAQRRSHAPVTASTIATNTDI